MKKKKVGLMSIVLAIAMLFSAFLSGCSLFSGGDGTPTEPTEYTIQYTDDSGTHTLTVTDGATYALEVLPERMGYDFIGLFDAEVGGTQYVSANGSALSPFSDKKNLILFPQFSPKEYTVVLDYQGAEITGQRSVTVNYDEKLPELPKNLVKDHSVFSGWYTQTDCGGIQVADAYGLIPDKSTVNEELFNIADAEEYLYLYAGFSVETFTVTFNFGSGIASEEVEVEYGTPISEVVPQTRNSKGEAVLSWSKTSGGGQIFNGNITDDIVLYAAEWAPVIEFDLNGGEGTSALIARANSSITLPTPTRTNYKFLHWETESGNEATYTRMPSGGAQLKAVWQAMLVFDENGGTSVDDISQEVETAITLPEPEKEGFIFAGWYTADKEKYESTSMPSTSVELKAGWYETKTETIVLIKDSNDEDDWAYSSRKYSSGTEASGPQADWRREIDLSEKVAADGADIKISVYYDMKTNVPTSIFEGGFYLYDNTIVSDANFLMKHTDTVSSASWKSFGFEANLSLRSNRLFFCYYAKKTNSDGEYSRLYFKNFYVELTYPDITNLYL